MQDELTADERDRVASGIYRSARKRGARDTDVRSLLKLRTGKSRTRELTDDELLAIRDEVLALPAVEREKRPTPETPEAYEERRRREELTR